MPDFSNGVATPGGASYMAPLLNFAQFGNWAQDFQQGGLNSQQQRSNDQKYSQSEQQFPYQLTFDQQQQKMNEQRIAEAKRQADLAKAFPNGLPIDPNTGQVDYAKTAQVMAKFGDVGDAVTLLGQQPAPMSAMLGGGGQPQGQPSSVPAKPVPPPAANAPQGDSGSGTVAALVTSKLPNEDATTGQTIAKVAQVMGVDPNAQLTPGQQRRAQGLIQKYAPGDAVSSGGGEGGTLPPSANAVAPAPKVSAAPAPGQGAPNGAGSPQPQPQPVPQPQPAPVAPQAAPQPQQQGQPNGPITPQVPLPKGFTDPQAAILALKTEAARLGANPKAAEQVVALKDWAKRIEDSIKPVAMRSGETLLDPKTGQPIYQGNQPTLSPDAINAAAERYIETGQMPPNMGRGVQGSATMSAIQNHAAELAGQRGIDMATLPGKWQQFKAQQVAIQRFTSGKQGDTIKSFNVLVDHLDTLGDAASALKNGDNRFFNKWKQNWAAQTGGTAPTNFDGVKALVGDEIIKAVVGGAGALADREEVKKDLDRASSPKQLSELVDKYRKLALGQLKGLRKQYEVATGQKNFGDMLLPGTLAALGGNEGKGSAPDAEGWVTLPNGARIQEVK